MESWVFNRVQSVARNRLVLCGLVLLAVVLLLSLQSRYLYNFAFGPFEISADELGKIEHLDDLATPFVKIHGDEVIDTGLQEITVRKKRGVETGRSVSAGYYALSIEDHFLLVKAQSQLNDYVGELERIPGSLSSNLFSDPEMETVRGAFYPFYLNTSNYRVPGYLEGVALLVFAIFFLRSLIPALRDLRDPAASPLARRMASWGHPTMVTSQIERDATGDGIRIGGWKLGETFMVQSGWRKFDVQRYEDLLWGFKHVTRQHFYFIPVGKSVAAKLHFKDGEAEIRAREKKIDQALMAIIEQAPWAIFGHDPEIEEAFKKRRSEMVEGVNLRRRRWEEQAAADATVG